MNEIEYVCISPSACAHIHKREKKNKEIEREREICISLKDMNEINYCMNVSVPICLKI